MATSDELTLHWKDCTVVQVVRDIQAIPTTSQMEETCTFPGFIPIPR